MDQSFQVLEMIIGHALQSLKTVTLVIDSTQFTTKSKGEADYHLIKGTTQCHNRNRI